MFEDYESDVLKDYHEKKAKGELVSNLMHSTPGSLRNECVVAFDRGPQKKDEIILKSFFQLKDDPETHRAVIKKWDRDKFRPLNLVLNNGSIKTAEQNIELLAWLIGFELRPYAFWLKNRGGEKREKNVVREEEGRKIEDITGEEKYADFQDGGGTADILPSIDVGRLKKTSRASFFFNRESKIALAVLMVFVIVGMIWFNWPPIPRSQKCMFWNGDQYEPIACDKKPADTTIAVIGLDTHKLIHFKRITRADTLTAFSIGKVWYIRINGGVEYYTAPGEHPLDPKRRLLPLTAHILDIYPRNPG